MRAQQTVSEAASADRDSVFSLCARAAHFLWVRAATFALQRLRLDAFLFYKTKRAILIDSMEGCIVGAVYIVSPRENFTMLRDDIAVLYALCIRRCGLHERIIECQGLLPMDVKAFVERLCVYYTDPAIQQSRASNFFLVHEENKISGLPRTRRRRGRSV